MAVRSEESEAARQARETAEQALRTRAFVDVRTVAIATAQAERVVREAIANGEIKTVRLGRSIRIPTAPLRRAWGLE